MAATIRTAGLRTAIVCAAGQWLRLLWPDRAGLWRRTGQRLRQPTAKLARSSISTSARRLWATSLLRTSGQRVRWIFRKISALRRFPPVWRRAWLVAFVQRPALPQPQTPQKFWRRVERWRRRSLQQPRRLGASSLRKILHSDPTSAIASHPAFATRAQKWQEWDTHTTAMKSL